MRVLAALIIRPGGPPPGGATLAARHLSHHASRLISLDLAEMALADATLKSDDGLRVFACRSYGLPNSIREKLPRQLQLFFSPLYASSIPRLLRRGNYDLVHIHNWHPIWAALQLAIACRRSGIPYVISTHGFVEWADRPRTMGLNGPGRLAYRLLIDTPFKYVVRKSAMLYAGSPFESSILSSLGIPDGRVRIVPNGAHPRMSHRRSPDELSEVRQKFNLPSRPLLLFVGRIQESKGVELLMKAVATLQKDCHLCVVGDLSLVEMRNALMRLRAELHCEDRITFTGYVETEDLCRLYQAASLFVFPSLSDTFPLSVLDAMACGRAIIASRVGGIPYQLTEGAGLLVEPGDPEALRAAVAGLLEDHALREEMGRRAMQRVKSLFSWERAAELAVSGYRDVLKGRN